MALVKKTQLPFKRDGIKADNPEDYYEFGDVIGKGKFAVVKKCTHKKSEKTYAAKIIKFDDQSLKYAIREYDLMVGGEMVHQGLVQLHEAYLVRKYLILIIDLVEGKTILDHVSSMESITEDDVAKIVRKICEILDDLHKKNIVHLDVRSTSIRFTDFPNLKLVDYNSARKLANKKAGEVVDVIGNTEFCAPEMLSFDRVQPGSDMWSVGVLTYVLLSGISPFYNEDESKLVASVQTVKWDEQFGNAAFANITFAAKEFIKKCFKKGPEMRMTADVALQHKWLSADYLSLRETSKVTCQDLLKETDKRMNDREANDYVKASLVFRTFGEEENVSPDEADSDSD